jgi:hypothetical protein
LGSGGGAGAGGGAGLGVGLGAGGASAEHDHVHRHGSAMHDAPAGQLAATQGLAVAQLTHPLPPPPDW